MKTTLLVIALILNLCFPLVYAISDEITDAEWEQLLKLDEGQKASSINEGKLVFLTSPPPKPVHHHHNTLFITIRSLEDGWIGVHQCHKHLDKVSRAEVVFRKSTVRKLKIESFRNIGRVWIEDGSVQLSNVKDNAHLCISAQSRALYADFDGTFTLRNGPYMRKFLDGYYPMRVSIDVEYPAEILKFIDVYPPKQPGFKIIKSAGQVHVDTWFEGRLRTEIYFNELPMSAN